MPLWEHEREEVGREGVIEMGGLSDYMQRKTERDREMERRLLFSRYVVFLCVSDRYQDNSTC